MPSFSGIWNMPAQMQARGQDLWPAAPGSPTIGVATGVSSTSVSVSFTPPNYSGYPADVSYTVISSPDGVTAIGTSSPIVVGGLTTGTPYTFTVTAKNSTGSGPSSDPSNTVTPATYWIGNLSNNRYVSITGVARDPSKNVYFGSVIDDPTTVCALAKYNSDGVIQWQKKLSANVGTTRLVSDSAGNIYGVGSSAIIKYSPSGSILWQQSLGAGVAGFASVTIDSNNNVYTCGYVNPGSNGCGAIAKYNSSGTLQWQKQTTNAGSNYFAGISVDSAGNVFVSGYTPYGSVSGMCIVKYNSSGIIQWQKGLRSTLITGYAYGNGMALDGNGNSYIVGYYNHAAGQDSTIAKYDTNGNLLWQNKLSNGNICRANSVCVGSDNNVYVSGYLTYSNNWSMFFVAKYNTDGVIQWQRFVYDPTYGESGGHSTVASYNDGVVVCWGCAPDSAYNRGGMAKIPYDGSHMGTFNVGGYNYSIVAGSLTSSSGVLPEFTTGITSDNGSLSSSTTYYSTSASTLTSSVTTI